MNSIDALFPENLYHSYVVEGDPHSTALLLRTSLEKRKDIGMHNPDVLSLVYDSFTSADISEIKNWHSLKRTTSQKKICIISTKFINHEAEQSLLKIIEEPQEGTHFFLVVPNASVLLDTILSRTHLVRMPDTTDRESVAQAEEFIKAPLSKRLTLVAEIIDENKSNETSGGLRFSATELVNALERIVHERFKKDKTNSDIQFMLSELGNARLYMSTPGASVKMILEHIALVL